MAHVLSLSSLKKAPHVLFLLLVLLFLNACKAEEVVEEDPEVPGTNVSVLNLNQSPNYTLKEVGLVKPFQEVEVTAKTGGILESVPVKVGDEVKADQLLGQIEQNEDDLAAINLSNASNQLANAQRTYDEAIANSQVLAKQAKLRAENLEATLQRLNRNLVELMAKNGYSENSLNFQIDNAQKGLDNAQLTTSRLKNQLSQSWDDFFKNTQVTFEGIFVNAQSYYQMANGILNPNNQHPLSVNDLSDVLGDESQSQRQKVVRLYNDFSNTLKSNEARFRSLSSLNAQNIVQAVSLAEETVEAGQELTEALKKLLEASSGPETTLGAYKTQVSAMLAGWLKETATINATESSYKTLASEQNNQLMLSQNNGAIAGNQLADVENSLDQFQVTQQGSEQDLQAQIEATKRDLDSAYLDYESALLNSQIQASGKALELQTYQNQVKSAQRAIKDTQITSPIQGVVSEVLMDEGESVNPGTKVFKINQQDQLKVVFYVSEEQSQWLEVGQQVFAKVNYNEKVIFSGRLIQIDPNADAQNHKIKVEAAFDKGVLKPEMFVNVEVEVSDRAFNASSFYIPLNAVIFNQNDREVFVAENTEEGWVANKKEVKIGQVLDEWVEITAGLSAEDLVILEGGRGLELNEKIQIISS